MKKSVLLNKTVEDFYNLSNQLISRLNRVDSKEEVINETLQLIKEFTECDAAGIRLKAGEDYPYYIAKGFSADFIKVENNLCLRDSSGQSRKDSQGITLLACMCGNVIRNWTDNSLPFFSDGGSFWTNSTSSILNYTAQYHFKTQLRFRCNKEGYESMALLPIKINKEIIGLLQLNYKQSGVFSQEIIRQLEKMTDYIGIMFQVKNFRQEILSQKKELEYRQLKTQYFSNLSHELKTPLNLILSALQMQTLYLDKLKHEDHGKFKRLIVIIKQNSYRLLRLINNLIDINKIDADLFNIQLYNLDIVKVITDITFSVQDYIRNNGRYFYFKTQLKEKIIACDPVSIERIMLNLLSNAVKFTDEEDTISVKLLEENGFIKIIVKDTGIGIKEEKQELIFQEFKQIDQTQNRNREGSGLGLSIVKSLVDMHNGKISLKSKYGVGSVFTVEIPIKTIEQTEDNYQYRQYFDKVEVEFSDIENL